jgi:two-component system, OmpR family, phosphate regulon sensor histidine kinase PhoR
MSNSIIRRLLILGGLAIAGILFIQSYIIIRTWNVKQQEFNQTVYIALRKVAESISIYNGTELPKQNLIQRRSSNVYAVNINSAIDANVLEDYLEQEFIKNSIHTNFEYAVYDCATGDLLYGNYCVLSNTNEQSSQITTNLPKFSDLIYYFVVKFPQREGYLLTTMRQSLIFSGIALLAVVFFLYSIYVILKQKQLTELQKDFINNMTHEFKTPIASIKIASEVLARSPELKDNPRLIKYANIIADQNQRLNTLVEKVLDLAKLESDQFTINKEEIPLPDYLQTILDGERLKFEEIGGTLDFHANDLQGSILGDKLHFANIVSNILENARKYCLEHANVIVSLKQKKHSVILRFRDNGIGIDKEEQKKLFNKFYRVPTGNVHNVKGFGLGLFYVNNICEAHGWDLSVESELGRGSIFSIEIPIPEQS